MISRTLSYNLREVGASLSAIFKQSVACAKAMYWIAITWKQFSTTCLQSKALLVPMLTMS